MGASPAIAQENAGGANSYDSASGELSTPTIVATAVGVGIVGAIIANNRGGTTVVPDIIDPPPVCNEGEVLVDGECVTPPPVCNEGEVLVDGECVDPGPVVTVTNTVTSTNPVTVTNTVTNTVAVTSTNL